MGEDMNKRICLNKSVLNFIEGVLRRCKKPLVLEFGSGWSSVWFAERCDRFVTVETDRIWAPRIRAELFQGGFNNWYMIIARPAPVIFSSTVDRYMRLYGLHEESVDLALIDCREGLRDCAARLAWRFLKPGGWILFDDAQRVQHKHAVRWLIKKAGQPVTLEWQRGDVKSAKERMTLAWQKEV